MGKISEGLGQELHNPARTKSKLRIISRISAIFLAVMHLRSGKNYIIYSFSCARFSLSSTKGLAE